MTAPYAVQVEIDSILADDCKIALPLSITHGRSGVVEQPDAPEASFTYLGSSFPGAVGSLVEIGVPAGDQALWVDDRVSWVDGEYTWLGNKDTTPKFVGSISELTAVEVLGAVVQWEVRCIGRQGALGRIPILMIRPAETDINRIQAIAAEVGYVLNVTGTSDLLLAPDTIDTNALSALHQVAASSGGMLWQGRSGDLWYGTANHRELGIQVPIDCPLILDGVAWTNDQEEIINEVTVSWGQESASEELDSVWTYVTGAGISQDPGAGNVRIDAVSMDVSRMDGNGFDRARMLRNMPLGTTFYAQQKNDSDDYLRGSTSGPVIDYGTHFYVPYAAVETGGNGIALNDVLLIRWGSESKQQRTYTDDASLAQWGRRALSIDTLLLGQTEAGQLGLLILGRRAQPFWRMPGVIADFRDASSGQADRLNSLDVSTGVTLPIEINPSPTPGKQTEWTCEGWVEEWGDSGHVLQIALSDRERTGGTGLRNWGEMRDAGNWTYWAGKKWINALVKGVGE